MSQYFEDDLNKFPNLFELLGHPAYTKHVLQDERGTGTSNAMSISSGEVIGQDDVFDSDSRLKTEIAQVGTTLFGLPLYNFKYIGRAEVYEGVMAQDVLKVMPSAVLTGSDGFYRVNYKD